MHNLRILSFIASPLRNVPPPVNSSAILGLHGFSVLLVGFSDNDQNEISRIGKNLWILKVSLKSRKLSIPYLRKIFALLEYIFIIRVIAKKFSPKLIISFNEAGAIILRLITGKKILKVSWFLEFPESFTKSIGEFLLHKVALSSLKMMDAVIFPTQIRKAMICVKKPVLIHKKLFVIHNVPVKEKGLSATTSLSESYYEGIDFLSDGKKSIKIIYAGAVGKRYGWDSLIKAVGNIEMECKLLILGVKHELGTREFSAAISGCRKKQSILWVESVPYSELTELLEMADAGFVSYRGDSLNTYFSAPGKLYEYLKAGLIILGDRDISIAEELESENCGIFFSKPYDETDIMDSLNRMNGMNLQVMKNNSKKLYEEKYNMSAQMTPFINWINEYE